MEEDTYPCEDRVAVLPQRWREQAKERGALPRARTIKTPEDLLNLIVLCNRREILWEPIGVVTPE